ncbi:hypothetical protein BKA70DRAFT_1276145 [Coprinopsis sp. MPI-PUGE-AT-0042]|nr:hypothetical protein BKA70DRAFT_1276145 [Coprinopsis sp. MPI-PUGE-AT-0042]
MPFMAGIGLGWSGIGWSLARVLYDDSSSLIVLILRRFALCTRLASFRFPMQAHLLVTNASPLRCWRGGTTVAKNRSRRTTVMGWLEVSNFGVSLQHLWCRRARLACRTRIIGL